MARIRTIKPEFFTSESVLSVSPLARLFFIGLWCEADRDGRLKWKPRTLKFRYLPADNADIDKLSDELINEGMINIYSVGEVEYCEIPSFASHQVINNRERESDIPPNDIHASTTRQPRVKAEGRKEGKGKEGKGTGDSIDYQKIKEIFNSTLTKASNVVKLTDKRKKLVKKLFTDFDLDYGKFEAYLGFINNHPDTQWMFEARPKNDGSGQNWKPQTFEYFVGEKCFLNAKENL
ncbi:hypothetical protein NVP1176O_47 [Vibrio phage 1.176.O._10N.261.55.F5]|nr:hypothetical protein NVP1176O_47 [Vibrio phage 1.176.O._10N.261.55.F5]